MNYKEEFLQMLQKGRSMDSIADEITRALNAANIEYEHQKQAEASKRKEKVDATNNFISSIYKLLSCWDLGISEREFKEVIKDSGELVDELDKALGSIQETEDSKKVINPIEEFLNKYVR